VNLAPNDIREDENDKAAIINLDQEYEVRYDNNKPILFNLPIILFFLWLVGMFLSFSSVIVQNYKFNNLIRKESIISEQKIINLFEECKAKMYITKLIPLIATKMVNVPTLYGVITPRILLPQNILKTLTMDDLRFIFLHELSHFKRKDIWVYLILTILTSLHWFNPFIRYAFHKMREDCMLILLKHTTMVKVL
jgi:bla regulator protein BlaR1